MKILAIQFRYLGDAVLMTPALRALVDHYDGASLHVVVAEEVAPLLDHIPWIERGWRYPRRRHQASMRLSLPVIRGLRRLDFDRSVDFGGNDRGAIVSRLCGARRRLGSLLPGGFLGRRHCYTEAVPPVLGEHEVARNLRVLSAWDIEAPASPRLEIHADPALAEQAAQILPRPAVICHLSTSQAKKEWPLEHWAELRAQAAAGGLEMVFSAGTTPRETALLEELKRRVPGLAALPPLRDLSAFLAVLNRARLFISGDTGPLHFAAALGVPTIALFGPSASSRWAPLGPLHRVLEVKDCDCRREDTALCSRPTPCLAGVTPPRVLEVAAELLRAAREPTSMPTDVDADGRRRMLGSAPTASHR